MYSYTDCDDVRNIIVLRHVTNVFQKDASDTFEVCLDNSAMYAVDIPSECYEDFIEKLGEYITRRG